MTSTEAKHIAHQYALGMGEVLSGFRFGIGDETEFINKYYFDFIWLTLDGRQPDEPPVAGGARGLTVDKLDKHVALTTHGDYCDLVREESELNEMYQLFVGFKVGKMHLTDIKNKLNLSSKQLLKFSKLINDTDLSKEKIYQIIADLKKKVAN